MGFPMSNRKRPREKNGACSKTRDLLRAIVNWDRLRFHTITITIRKHPSHNRKAPGIFSTRDRGPARGSHDRGGYDLLVLSAGMFDHTPWHPHLPQGTTPRLVPAAMWSPRPCQITGVRKWGPTPEVRSHHQLSISICTNVVQHAGVHSSPVPTSQLA